MIGIKVGVPESRQSTVIFQKLHFVASNSKLTSTDHLQQWIEFVIFIG